MKKYAFSLQVRQAFSEPILKHGFLLRCIPGTYPFQRSYAHHLTITPHAALTHIPDTYGNEMYTGTIDKAHQAFAFSASGFVLSSKYLTHDPLDRLYLYPTEYTLPSPQLKAFLSSLALPQDPWEKAIALCTHTNKALSPSGSDERRAADAVFASRQGDARDYAHVLLTLLRLSGIAGRFVSGLAVGIPQVHSWVEVYCGGLWRALDPFTDKVIEEGYLKIAHGPDYNACAVERSCYLPEGVPFTRSIQVEVTEHVIRTRDTVPHA